MFIKSRSTDYTIFPNNIICQKGECSTRSTSSAHIIICIIYSFHLKTVKILITFLIVNFAWIFFRMPTLGDACAVISQIFDFSQPMKVEYNITNMAFSVFGITVLFVKDFTEEFTCVRFFYNRNVVIRWSSYVFVLSCILLAGVFGADQSIYSNF